MYGIQIIDTIYDIRRESDQVILYLGSAIITVPARECNRSFDVGDMYQFVLSTNYVKEFEVIQME